MIPVLNSLGLAGMTGHWDFAYGPARLQELASRLTYPMLAVNCYHEDSQKRVFPAFSLWEMGTLRVGVIGVAATIVDKTMPPHFSKGISLTLGKDELPETIAHLRDHERVNLIVVVSHLGFAQDLQLAEDVSGIDVLLSAHTHNRVRTPARVNDTLVIQSGCHGSFIGRLDLTIEGGRITDYQHALITVSESVTPDPDVQALVDDAMSPYREPLSEVVGRTDVALNRNTVFEATMDNFLLQAALRQTDAQVAFSNGWRYGAPIPIGPITRNDLYNITPMNPPIGVVDLTGEEIQHMLEENLEHTFSRQPYQQLGGYLKRMAGVTMYAKLENPHGQRIQQLFVQGKPLDLKRVYSTAFVTEQGVPAKYGTNRQLASIFAVEAMRELLLHSAAGWELSGSFVAI
jgi:2',3'-cyclic-nucleotide 2'-phosphodiesterase (5'-nucleotidase family)